MSIAGYGCLRHGREACDECRSTGSEPTYAELKAEVAALKEWRENVLLEYVEGVMTNGLGRAIEAPLEGKSEL